MEALSDNYYIGKVQEGDTAAFACLLDRYASRVHALLFRIVRNREDAEELAQDVFMKAFRHLSGFKGESHFSTWLYRIAYNTAISATRKQRKAFLALDDSQVENVSETEVTDALGFYSDAEQLERLDLALDQLPPEERALLLLFYKEEKSVEEISRITGMTTSNVKTRMHRIRKKLFVLLKGMEDSAQ